MAKRSSSAKTTNGDGSGKPDFESGFLVAGVGASAGGIQALSQFFANVPSDSGVAYVVILHLSPSHDSRLAHVLQQSSVIPVEQVTKRTRIEPNHVYVVPPDKSLSMEDGSIVVKPLGTVEERRAPVDIFFRTLADSHGPNAVGVILSGTGANGSMGLKRIKERGGATFVQNPREAEFSEMPRNSIATELVDSILPVARIPQQIIIYRDRSKTVSINDDHTEQAEEQQNALREVFVQLRARTGHDFSNYKRPTMLRRIERRISVRNLPDLTSYAEYLRENPSEANALLKDLLISVTNFFRDKKSFEFIEKEVFPRLMRERDGGQPIRIWVAGCATGEEAYSLAMIAAEQMAAAPEARLVQIFATDIDKQAIAAAREGVYSLNDAADVSPERLRRFFSQEGENYRVRREIREMVLFAQHNLIKDPPFSRLDMVTCRNLLIYLNHTAQERVMETAHFALRPGGYLFIGSSESVDGAGDLFAAVSKENHIYQSRPVAPRPFPVPESVPKYSVELTAGQKAQQKETSPLGRITYQDLHLRLLEEYGPPSIVIDEDYEIVHLSARAGKYLEVIGGEPTNNLLRLIRPDIRIEMRTALYQAVQQRSNVEVGNLKVRLGEETEVVNILIRPVLAETDTARGFILVLFEPVSDADRQVPHADYAPPEPVAEQLEEELIRSRTQLQTSLEQSEVQAEELRASNEELQAANEELRSSAEELETSKEELQSINEELGTVNQELKVKIDELSHSNNNFINLLNSVDIGVVFLDRRFRVNLFSPAAREIFNLISNDIGRPLSDITNKLQSNQLPQDADEALGKLRTVEREVATVDGRIFMSRIFPYRTAEDHIEGVVATFFDITERKRTEEALAESEEQFRRAIEDAPVPTIMHAEDGEVLQVSRVWTELTGYTIKDVPTLEAWLTNAYGKGADAVRGHMHELFKGDKQSLNVEFHIRTRRGDSRYWSFSASSPGTLRDGRRYIVGMAADITDRKRSEDAISFQSQLLNSVQQSVIATDVQGKVTFWNPFAEQLFGWTADEALGRNILDLTTPVIVAQKAEEIMERVRRGESRNGEFLVKRRDGTFFTAQVVNSPIHDAEGNLIGIIGVSMDLEEQRKTEKALRLSEEKVRLLMESFTDYAIMTADLNGIVESWNPGAETIFGFAAEEMIGKSLDIVFTPEDRANDFPERERASAREKGRASDERWHIRKDGTKFFASGVMVPLFDRERLVGYAKIARDLTEQKRVSEQLQQSREGLEKAVDKRTEELNDTNESLRREINERRRTEEERVALLRKIVTTQEDERRRIAREIHDQLGQRLTALRLKIAAVKDLCGENSELLDRVARLEELGAGLDKEVSFIAWELRPAVLDDFGLAAAIENYIREWSQHFEIAAEFHTTGLKRRRLDPAIETNLYRIVQEALNNISKHASAKGANVLLELRKKEVVMVIEDNGVGLDTSDQVRNRDSGHGLGIIGMQERAAICGGSVEIESAPGEGTTLFVRVPAVFAEKEGHNAQ
jgi:two-component system, chemotaxis family, CheB/CheR fusion protein